MGSLVTISAKLYGVEYQSLRHTSFTLLFQSFCPLPYTHFSEYAAVEVLPCLQVAVGWVILKHSAESSETAPFVCNKIRKKALDGAGQNERKTATL